MKVIQKLFGVIIIFVLLNCESRENVEPKYKEISGLWKLENLDLNGMNYQNESLTKFDMLDIPYHKYSNKKRTNELTKFGMFIVNDSTKGFGFENKINKFYKIRNHKDIEFHFLDQTYGYSQNFNREGEKAKNIELTEKIFTGIWRYEIISNILTLTRNKIMTDSLGGLKLVYRKAN